MGLPDSIKYMLGKAGETFIELQERKELEHKIKLKILQKLSVKQLKALCDRYGESPRNYLDDLLEKSIPIKRTASDYVREADVKIRLDEVKDFAIAHRISISDILNEEKRIERELDKKWEMKKSKGLVPDHAGDNFLKQVINTIEDFQPSRVYRHEQEYHNELQGWMKAHFKEATVEHQTGSSRPDIVIDTRIAIEVKGPTRPQDLTTIADKCNRYLQYYENLIVVIFDVHVNERFYDEWLKGIKDHYPEVKIIRK